MHFNPYDLGFLALAPISALVSLGLKRRRLVVVTIAAVAMAGWALVLASQTWEDARETARFETMSAPTAADVARYNSDSGLKISTLFFGFPLSLAYTTLCFILVRSGQRLLHRWRDA
jgi:hypothetical protein